MSRVTRSSSELGDDLDYGIEARGRACHLDRGARVVTDGGVGAGQCPEDDALADVGIADESDAAELLKRLGGRLVCLDDSNPGRARDGVVHASACIGRAGSYAHHGSVAKYVPVSA
jgi:hypothetical protein